MSGKEHEKSADFYNIFCADVFGEITFTVEDGKMFLFYSTLDELSRKLDFILPQKLLKLFFKCICKNLLVE